MRRLTTPKLSEVVLHEVVPAERTAVLSDVAPILDEDAEGFLEAHLARGLRDKSASAAALDAEVPVAGLVLGLLDGGEELLPVSRALAEDLAQRVPARLGRFTLAFCTFTSEAGGDSLFFAC